MFARAERNWKHLLEKNTNSLINRGYNRKVTWLILHFWIHQLRSFESIPLIVVVKTTTFLFFEVTSVWCSTTSRERHNGWRKCNITPPLLDCRSDNPIRKYIKGRSIPFSKIRPLGHLSDFLVLSCAAALGQVTEFCSFDPKLTSSRKGGLVN